MSKIIEFQVETEMMPMVILNYISNELNPFAALDFNSKMELRTQTIREDVYLHFIQTSATEKKLFMKIEAHKTFGYGIALFDFFNAAKLNNPEVNDWLKCKILDAFNKKFEEIL